MADIAMVCAFFWQMRSLKNQSLRAIAGCGLGCRPDGTSLDGSDADIQALGQSAAAMGLSGSFGNLQVWMTYKAESPVGVCSSRPCCNVVISKGSPEGADSDALVCCQQSLAATHHHLRREQHIMILLPEVGGLLSHTLRDPSRSVFCNACANCSSF
jgi:hypothetical protein